MTDHLRALVLDDDPVAVEVVAAHLAAAGIAAIRASDVDQALALLAEGPIPDVVVSDVMMPERDGFDLCAHLRDDPRLQHLPVLFVTAMGDRDARIRALDEGADDLIAKPVDEVELVARVRSLARLSRMRSERRDRARFDAVAAAVADAVVVTNVAGEVRDANAAAGRLLAVDVGDGLEVALDRLGFTELRRLDGASGLPTVVLQRPGSTNGSDLIIELITSVLRDPSGQPETWVHVAKDVTQRERAVNGARFVLDAITHKFRTPLTGLRGGLDLLGGRELGPHGETILELMDSSLARIERTILRVVEHAERIGAGSEHEPFDLAPANAINQLRELVPDHDDILSRANIVLPSTVVVPRAVVGVAIAELLDNAVRAASGRDAVTLLVQADDDELTIVVEDDGPGLASEDQDRVWDPFFQSDLTGQAEGLGLGLPIVRQVVTNAGGAVDVEYRPGDGTRFRATVPVGDCPRLAA